MIIETTSGNYVLKKNTSKKDISKIFNYLKKRDFLNYPEVVLQDRLDDYVYKYIDNSIYNPNRYEDLIILVALLHSKTSYNKEISKERYKKIYEDIKNNIMYLDNYYLKYYELFINNVYMSPSEYEFIRNYSKIKSNLNFSSKELEEWFNNVQIINSERVSLIHNNLKIDHFIDNYLISWDKATFDTPVLDLYNLYKNDYWDLEFSSLYNKYKSINPLNDNEEKLLFILLSLVPKISFEGSEFNKCKDMRKKLDYIYKTEEFLKPYYSTNTKEE